MDKVEEGQVAVVAEAKPKRASLRKGEKAAKSPETAVSTVEKKAAAKPVATKPEEAKVAAKTGKAKPKAEKPAVAFVARIAHKGKPIFALDEISRPRSGRLLLAHTHAALSVLGLLSEARPAIPKASLLTLIGARAVKYHIDNDNLEAAPDNGIRLSVKGYNTFKTRSIDAAAANAFTAAFLDGKADAAINVKARNLYQTNLG